MPEESHVQHPYKNRRRSNVEQMFVEKERAVLSTLKIKIKGRKAA